MLNSKNNDIAFSFIMGVDDSIKEKLNGINTTYNFEEEKYYLASIPKSSIIKYEQIISKYLKPGF